MLPPERLGKPSLSSALVPAPSIPQFGAFCCGPANPGCCFSLAEERQSWGSAAELDMGAGPAEPPGLGGLQSPRGRAGVGEVLIQGCHRCWGWHGAWSSLQEICQSTGGKAAGPRAPLPALWEGRSSTAPAGHWGRRTWGSWGVEAPQPPLQPIGDWWGTEIALLSCATAELSERV